MGSSLLIHLGFWILVVSLAAESKCGMNWKAFFVEITKKV